MFNIHTQVCALTFFCTNAAVQSFGAFVPSILRDFGWTSTEAQLKSVPPYLVACVCTIALGWASDRSGKRGPFIAGAMPTAITGFAILRWSTDPSAKYAAVFLNAIGCFAASAGMLSWGINSELQLEQLDKFNLKLWRLTESRCRISSRSGRCWRLYRGHRNHWRSSIHVRLAWTLPVAADGKSTNDHAQMDLPSHRRTGVP